MAAPPLRFSAVLQRHHPDLPVYLLVPPEIPAAFAATQTFVAEAEIDGRPIGRRSVKPWSRQADDDRWFLELTKAQLGALGLEAGGRVEVALAPARAVPEDLEAAVAEAGVQAAWAALGTAERRAIAEAVFAAKGPETRRRRIDKALAVLRAGRR